MKKLYFLLFTFLITSFSFGQDMVITGVFDGPLTGGTPKAVEIYVINNISDLSTFGFGSANNGGGTDGEELSFTGAANAGDFIYLTANEADFETYFGFAADFVDNSANNNGDDALELFSGGVVIDTFGDIATDGNGEPWEYTDGWAYRTSSTGPDGATFSLGNWSFSGINAVDGCTDNGSCSSSFPVGTFTYGGTPCGISLGTAVYACATNTIGDNNDGVTVEIPYTGLDATITSVSTTSGGTVAGSNPALDTDGTITITGLFEGDAWDLTINGGNCDTTTVSGTIPVAECDPSLTVNVGITGTVDGVYINEIHYDNTDADVGEFFEVAGPAGTDLSSYTVSLYNGSDDELYGSNDTFNLTGTIDDEGSGVGAIVVSLPSNGLQNGGPDGLSLSKTGSNDIQFLSYEGVIASAGDGPAIGLASVDIGVSENQADTPAGYSLEYDETTTSWIVVTDDTPGDFAQGTALSNGDFNLAKFSLFPNPTNSGYVNITSTNGGTINAKVFDILGKKVIDASIENNRLDVNQLKTGIYIIKMTQGTNSTTKKLVIE